MTFRLTYSSFVSFIVYITPFIDVINILTGTHRAVSFGQIARIIILGIMQGVLVKEQGSKTFYLIFLTVFLVFRDALYSIAYHVKFIGSVTYDLRYIYVLTFFALVMYAVQTKRLTEIEIRTLSKRFALQIAILILFSRFTGAGINYANSDTTRLFTEVNALSAILVWGLSLWLYEAFYGKEKIKNFLCSLIVLYSAFSQGTKAGTIGSVACIALIVFYSLFMKHNLSKGIVLTIFACVALFVIYRYYFIGESGMQHMLRWRYWLNAQDSIMSFLLSARDRKASNAILFYKKNPWLLFPGASFTLADYHVHLVAPESNYAATEMDIFDLFLFYGVLLGGAVALYLTWRAFRCVVSFLRRGKKAYDAASYLIFYILMFMGGHVLNSPLAGIAFCLSLLLTDTKSLKRGESVQNISALPPGFMARIVVK